MQRNVRETHNKHLRDPKVAAAYLSDAIENGDAAVIRLALRNILEANIKSAQKNEKIIINIDLDDTLCDYNSAYSTSKKNDPSIKYPQSKIGFYLNLKPMKDAIDVFKWLNNQSRIEVYILTAPSIYNPHCYSEKRIWVEQQLGFKYVDKLIISFHKNLLKGHYLIDDCKEGRGQENFEGEVLNFGRQSFPDWLSIRNYFQSYIKDDEHALETL